MRVLGTLGVAARAIAIVVGCKARTDDFYAKVWTCANNASDTCGTTRSGQPMTCYAASKLGGDDFCTEACDPAQGSADPSFVCVTSGASGALLQTCTPPGDAGAADGCPAGLRCYRTDLLMDQGLCIKMPVCSQNADCPENAPVCASTVIQQRTSLPFHVDGLQCLVTMCGSGGTPCPPGQGCLAGYFQGATASEYDICVPTCDGRNECPPNFGCAVSPQSSGSPSLCLPGVPGIRCQQNQDCVLGECLPTGAGFNECVPTFIACQTDVDCAVLDGTSTTFLCVEGVPGGGKHCILKEEFSGTNCEQPSDCPDGYICTTVGPFDPVMTHGECRVPCAADLSCPVRGGIPHVCLGGGTGGCYPTSFGLPCASAADCMPELDCRSVLPDPRTLIHSPTICTMTCTTDDDCVKNPLIRANVFCRQDEHLCRMTGAGGTPCDANDQCRSGACSPDGGTCTN